MRITWQVAVVALLVVFLGAALALQRQANAELQGMARLLREQNREVARLQEERARLLKAQVSATELEALRADHAAMVRLRGEIETAKSRLGEIERAEQTPAPR